MSKQFSFTNDRFKKARGGYSRLLLLHCERCAHPIATYQKDGPGILKRIYLDRVRDVEMPHRKLVCAKCGTLLGIPIVYEKERRPAIRLFAGAIGKRIIPASATEK